MQFIIIQNIMKASKRLRPQFHLRPPSETNTGPRRRDRTGFILFLCGVTLLVSIMMLL